MFSLATARAAPRGRCCRRTRAWNDRMTRWTRIMTMRPMLTSTRPSIRRQRTLKRSWSGPGTGEGVCAVETGEGACAAETGDCRFK